jgi:hypothetical protein
MSAKSCLLCGKALSRIWIGSGEDFCSREHRNQYRLRRGMDRLTEANKLASLMRKRENLKPIPIPEPTSESTLTRHSFEAMQHAAAQAIPLQVRLECSDKLSVVQSAGVKPLKGRRPPAARPQHAETEFRAVSKITPVPARSFDMNAAHLSAAGSVQSLRQAAHRGRDLRVCLAAGFRLRPPVQRALPVNVADTGLVRSAKTLSRLRAADMPALQPREVPVERFPTRSAEQPVIAAALAKPALQWPGARSIVTLGQAGVSQTHDVAFRWDRIESPLAIPNRDALKPADMPGPRAPRIFAVPVPPSSGLADARTTSVPFKPADAPFGYGSEELETQ